MGFIARSYTWPGLSQNIRRYARNCDVCRRTAVWRDLCQGLLKPLQVPERAWAELLVDLIVDPPSSKRATAIMVATDRLTKNVIFQAIESLTTDVSAKALIGIVFYRHSLPKAIVSDRAGQFAGKMWKQVCELWAIKWWLSAAHHPETGGAMERAVCPVGSLLSPRCPSNPCSVEKRRCQRRTWLEGLPPLIYRPL